MVGVGAVAALSIIAAGLVRVPLAAPVTADASAPVTPETPAEGRTVKVKRPVRYVRLEPGEKAPPGARVIREAAPTPRVIVREVAPRVQRVTRAPVARTRQSG